MADAALAGKLLVANPRLADPNFDRTVVLVLVHGEEGALGVVLNRPLTLPIADALPQWEAAAAEPALLFSGGPVGEDSVIGLARVSAPSLLQPGGDGPAMWQPVVGDLGTLDLELDPDVAGGALQALRIYSGYAGWAGGQLESELVAGGWWVLDPASDDPFTATPESLWHDVLRRQPGELALVSAYPPDPELN
jgi:putative transcriptional regulator